MKNVGGAYGLICPHDFCPQIFNGSWWYAPTQMPESITCFEQIRKAVSPALMVKSDSQKISINKGSRSIVCTKKSRKKGLGRCHPLEITFRRHTLWIHSYCFIKKKMLTLSNCHFNQSIISIFVIWRQTTNSEQSPTTNLLSKSNLYSKSHKSK